MWQANTNHLITDRSIWSSKAEIIGFIVIFFSLKERQTNFYLVWTI